MNLFVRFIKNRPHWKRVKTTRFVSTENRVFAKFSSAADYQYFSWRPPRVTDFTRRFWFRFRARPFSAFFTTEYVIYELTYLTTENIC